MAGGWVKLVAVFDLLAEAALPNGTFVAILNDLVTKDVSQKDVVVAALGITAGLVLWSGHGCPGRDLCEIVPATAPHERLVVAAVLGWNPLTVSSVKGKEQLDPHEIIVHREGPIGPLHGLDVLDDEELAVKRNKQATQIADHGVVTRK